MEKLIVELGLLAGVVAGAAIRVGFRRDPLPPLLVALLAPPALAWGWWLLLGDGDLFIRLGLVYLSILWCVCLILGAVLAGPIARRK